MADNEQSGPDIAGAPDAEAQPHAAMLTQYVKDLSFENPNAPSSLQGNGGNAPKIDVNVNVGVHRLQNEMYEVELKLNTSGKFTGEGGQEMVAFVCELSYCGLFAVRGMPEDHLRNFLLISAPTLLFPFARRIIADATRDGGFPPLMLEPINFQAMLQQQQGHGAEGPMPESAEGATVN